VWHVLPLVDLEEVRTTFSRIAMSKCVKELEKPKKSKALRQPKPKEKPDKVHTKKQTKLETFTIMTKVQLYELAKQHNIKNRSKMAKQDFLISL
jgi:hypothetical protein